MAMVEWIARAHMACGCRCWLAIALLGLVMAPVAAAQHAVAPAGKATLRTVVVTATRTPQRAFEVPAAVNAVTLNTPAMDRSDANPSAVLREVPGVLARDRQNYAQDEQISIRGFGARSTFGVRGIRLLVDGVPATMPDGQGELSNFNLSTASRIEVLRGPLSALYGNASGGVIQLFTADGTARPEQRAGFSAGPDGTLHADASALGQSGALGYNIGLEGLHTGGFRRHSAAHRQRGNAKLTWQLGGGGSLTLLANAARTQALDPQGLTVAQYLADPRQAAPSAVAYDTRKRVRQDQAGAVYAQPLGAHQQWRVLAYYGQRAVTQFLSVPASAQADPLSSGGVVALATRYGGLDARWTWHGAALARPLRLSVGVAWDREDQHRRGYEDFVGDVLGVVGALRRNEQDDVYDVDRYAQAEWDLAPDWSATLGVRHSEVRFATVDAYVAVGNPDDSGRVAYAATTPVVGLMWRAAVPWRLYAAFGRGFDTPTFNELSYRADGAAGLAFNLRPARSRHAELGSKLRWAGGAGKLDFALFQSNTRDALAVFGASGGRTTYQNVGQARRRGAEIDLDAPLGSDWTVQLAGTRLDARFTRVDACPATCTLAPGARIPGAARNQAYAALRWQGMAGWHAGLNVFALGGVYANDANTVRAPGYAAVGLDLGRVIRGQGVVVSPFVRIDNLFDRRYVGSLIVNNAHGGYFEPAPGRSVMLGLRARFTSSPGMD